MRTKTSGLGDLLIAAGCITRDQLEEALSEQRRTRERLGQILCKHGWITQENLVEALSQQLGHRRFDPQKDASDAAAMEIVPLDFARRHNVLPLKLDEERFIVALADPLDVEALDHLRRIARQTKASLEVLVGLPDEIEKARESGYGRVMGSRDVSDLITQVVDEIGSSSMDEEDPEDPDEAQRRAQDAGIIRFVDQIISQAIRERGTDIHIEPHEKKLLIRYRVDGILYDSLTPPRAVYTGTICRLKVLANMDIAERRAPQDGRFSHRIHGSNVDIRVSAIPTIHGEKLVLRLLDKTGFNFALRDLGFSETDYTRYMKAIRQPYGMILMSGPTGSGKSTTLYAGLLEMRGEGINITTIEDPVEYRLDGVNQVQVNERKQVTFSSALRAFLRQDPDVIMVGEVRDRDTAEIAIRAALTGHLVLSTTHANDAPTTATRIVSMGVDPFMAASAMTLVIAQRLVRRICQNCSEDYIPADDILFGMGITPGSDEARNARFRKGRGCPSCKNRGYKGRLAILEMMQMSTTLRKLMAENSPADVIRAAAMKEGMTTLRQSGLLKALDGVTTPEEVLRVCLTEE